MKYLNLLREQHTTKLAERNAITAEMTVITDAVADEQRTALTDDEQTKHDEYRGKVAELDAELDALEPRIAELEQVAERAALAATVPTVIRQPDAPAPTEIRTLSRTEVRDVALRTLEAAEGGFVTDENRSRVERLVRAGRTKNFDGDQLARRLALTENDAYRSAWSKAVLTSTPVFTPDEARALAAFDEFRAMSIGVDGSGGFGVPVLIDPTIILTSGAADAPILRLARMETITNDEWKGVSSTGVTWSFDAEAAAVSDDSPPLVQPTVTAHMARGFIPYSIEVGGDYPGFATEMSMLLDQGYVDLLASVTATGTGSGQPFGIITALDANTNVEVVVTSDGVFQAADIDKVWAALPERYRSRATWIMNVDVENEIRGFGSGTATSRFTVDQTEAGISRLNGRPVAITDYFPAFTGTTGAANILVVGDGQNYLVAQRAGMSVELVPHLFDVTNNRPTGQRGWFAHARVGADSVNDLGFRLLQNQ